MAKKKKRYKNPKKLKKSFLIPIYLLGISVLLMTASVRIDGFAQWYTGHIYPIFTGIIGRIFGIVPCSAAEIGLYGLLVFVTLDLVYIVLSVFHKVWTKEKMKKIGKKYMWIVSVLCFLYVMNCGINYRNTSFSEKSGICVREYSVEELAKVCGILTEEVQKTEPEISRNKEGNMIFQTEEKKNAVQTMQKLGEQYTDLKGYYPEPKNLLFPSLLSWQGLTGVYSPFTVEANYNNAMTAYNIPFTMCHELSHVKGFMQEQEANFIAWLACRQSDTAEFRYSGALSGWLYVSNLLWEYDRDTYSRLYDALPEGAKKDLKENNTFWKRYEGKIQEVSNKINDTYLKTNGQKDGVKSYDKMVDMLVVYLLDQKGE